MKLKANKMGTMKALKDSLKKGGSGNSNYIKNVPSDGITVRFLTEPEEWFGYTEYWDGDAKSFVPMVEGEILPDGAKPSFRYLTNAVDVDTDRVIPLKLAKTAANILILKYDKYDTITDRPYELQKHGEGLDTTYDVTPDAPSKMNIAKYDLLDLEQILVTARMQATGEVAETQSTVVDAPEVVKSAKKVTTLVKAEKEDEWNYSPYSYEGLFPNDQVRINYTEKELGKMNAVDQELVCEFWEVENTDDFITLIIELQEANDALDEEADVSVSEDDDEDDDYEIDEDELMEMSIADLRKIAGDIGVAHKGVTKEALIVAIIESAEA